MKYARELVGVIPLAVALFAPSDIWVRVGLGALATELLVVLVLGYAWISRSPTLGWLHQ